MTTHGWVYNDDTGKLHRVPLPDTEPAGPAEPAPLTRADLASMTPVQIDDARRAGKVDHLLNPPPPARPTDVIERATTLGAGRLTRADLAELARQGRDDLALEAIRTGNTTD